MRVPGRERGKGGPPKKGGRRNKGGESSSIKKKKPSGMYLLNRCGESCEGMGAVMSERKVDTKVVDHEKTRPGEKRDWLFDRVRGGMSLGAGYVMIRKCQ